jgi:hypothetical protein
LKRSSIAEPLLVSAHGTEVEHGLGVIGKPPGAGEFEAFLDEISMGAFDFAGTDGEMGLYRGQIIELSGAVGEVVS